MAALIGLSTAIFARTSYKNWTLSRLPRPEICHSGSVSFKKVEFHHPLILFRPLVCKSYVTSDTEVLTSLESEVSGIDKTGSSSTVVRVRFQLQEECKYGDKFFLVGNDPALGLWDPPSAIPLFWSDGNMWTVELDLRVDSTIGFKFILKQSTGEVIWQPGPDRILKTWESMNTIVVTEDWETAEEQELMEEETMNPDLEPALDESNSLGNDHLVMDHVNNDAMSGGNNNVSVNNELTSTEYVAHPGEITLDEGSVSNRKEMLTNNNNYNEFTSTENVAENYEKTKDDSNREEMLTNNNRWPLAGNNSPDEENKFSHDEERDDAALVPGNNSVTAPDRCPLQAASTEEVCTKEVESIIAGNDAVKD